VIERALQQFVRPDRLESTLPRVKIVKNVKFPWRSIEENIKDRCYALGHNCLYLLDLVKTLRNSPTTYMQILERQTRILLEVPAASISSTDLALLLTAGSGARALFERLYPDREVGVPEWVPKHSPGPVFVPVESGQVVRFVSPEQLAQRMLDIEAKLPGALDAFFAQLQSGVATYFLRDILSAARLSPTLETRTALELLAEAITIQDNVEVDLGDDNGALYLTIGAVGRAKAEDTEKSYGHTHTYQVTEDGMLVIPAGLSGLAAPSNDDVSVSYGGDLEFMQAYAKTQEVLVVPGDASAHTIAVPLQGRVTAHSLYGLSTLRRGN